MNQNWDAILLAAGSGTRMKSQTPKIMQKVAGTPMLIRIITELNKAGCQKINVVITEDLLPQLENLKQSFNGLAFYIQKKPLGTGDAVLSVPKADLAEDVFICNGDHPLMSEADIKDLYESYKQNTSCLTVGVLELEDPGSFGRVVSVNGKVERIVEAKQANPEELKIKEINTGLYFGKTVEIYEALDSLKNKERTTEFYLTDIVEVLQKKTSEVYAKKTTETMAFGVNDSASLYLANQKAYRSNNEKHLENGVKFLDIKNVYIDDFVEVGQDTFVYPNVYLKGQTKIAEACTIESGVHIFESDIGPETYIKAGSYLENVKVEGQSSIGPYARLREGTMVERKVKIGNFVETKKTLLKEGVKAGHQCYLGDSEIGEGTNIGAGTITCNFAVDGKKYKTKIGKNVFIGSDTQIVPPVNIGDQAVIAAGATVTKDVESHSLYVTRAKAFTKKNYKG